MPNVRIISDNSHRAQQARALQSELLKLELQRDIIISCGLDVAQQALAARRGEYLISIGDAGSLRAEFDALILPNHEPFPQHQNIIPITGLLNEITPQKLTGLGAQFKHFPQPRFAVILGGKHIGGDITQADIDAILAGAQGSKLVSTSRRTNEMLKIEADYVYNFNRDGQDANPYHELLAAADAVLVTADSARMMSEACSSGKPVYIYSPQALHFSYAALRDKLFEGGYAHNFADLRSEIRATKLLAEAKRVAAHMTSSPEFLQEIIGRSHEIPL